MNNFNLSDDKVNALLQIAAQKLGKEPDELKSQLQSGQLDDLAKKMDPGASKQLGALLQNPKAVEALLGNDKVRAMLDNLSKK